MRRLLLSGLMVLAFSVTAFAGVDVSKLQLPGDITQAQADTVIKGALAKAKEQGVPMNIAVVDAGGNLKAFTRMDGAFLGSIDISIGKAVPPACSTCRRPPSARPRSRQGIVRH